MLDLGWSEIAIIGLVAILVLGPKDLPRALRTLGQWSAKARGIVRDFQSNINSIAEEAELNEVRKQIESAADVEGDILKPAEPRPPAAPPAAGETTNRVG